MSMRGLSLKLQISLLLTTTFLFGYVSEAQDRYYCHVTEMPLSWAMEPHPVKITSSEAAFTDLGSADPSIKITNSQATAITNVAFVIEYVDKEDNVVDTAVAANAAKGYENAMPTPFPVENLQVWQNPVGPGEGAWVGGMSDGNRTISCPTAGRITFLMLRLKNGDVRQYASTAWQIPALPRMVPRLDMSCPSVGGLVEIPAILRINVAGEVIAIAPQDLASPDLINWAAARVRSWKFHPGLANGHPQASELKVDFIFYPNAEVNPAGLSLNSPAVLIQFFPSNRDAAPRCIEAFAFLKEGDTIP
jgi:hypothetical protein